MVNNNNNHHNSESAVSLSICCNNRSFSIISMNIDVTTTATLQIHTYILLAARCQVRINNTIISLSNVDAGRMRYATLLSKRNMTSYLKMDTERATLFYMYYRSINTDVYLDHNEESLLHVQLREMRE